MNITWISKIEWNMPHKTSRLKMSEALIKRGNNVTLYMVKKFGEKIICPNNIICIPTIHLPILSGFFYGLIIFFYFPILLKRKEIDYIIIDGTKVMLPFIIPIKILNKPIILDIRTLPIDKNESYPFKLSMFFCKYLIKGITTITPELKNILRDSYNIKKTKIGIWSSGVSIEDFEDIKIDKNNFFFNKENNHRFTLIYHGDYSPTRGIEDLIRSIGKLELSLKNKVRLLIVGMPQKKIEILLKLIKDEGINGHIHIVPKVSYKKIAQYIKISDAGIIPLPPENKWWQVSAPLKTLEYLASTKPIIATNIPFHNKIFNKGICGILLKKGTPEAIAEGITNLYKNKNELKNMGEIGKQIVEKFYTWDAMASAFENFLKIIAN